MLQKINSYGIVIFVVILKVSATNIPEKNILKSVDNISETW